MNRRQTSQTNMFEKMVLFFNNYKATLSAFAPLWAIIKQFFDKMGLLDSMLQKQLTGITGETKTKLQLAKDMSDALLPLARKARVWAGQQNNAVLETLFDTTESVLNQATLETVNLARSILKGLNDNAAALLPLNVTDAQLSAAGTAIDDLEASLALPGQAISVAKVGTEGLVKLINDISRQLHDCDDLLIPEYSISNEDMVKEYMNNRRIGNTLTHHTTLAVHVYADAAKANPVKGAVVNLPAYNRTATTDMEGVGVIETFKSDELEAVVSAAGFADKQIPFTIKNGQHLDVEVVMGA